MQFKIIIIFAALFLAFCTSKHSDLEVCFEDVKNEIGSDSILKKIKYCSIDSYRYFAAIIVRAVDSESRHSNMCSKSVDSFMSVHYKNGIGVNNLILFQYFQAYLKHENFDYLEAREKALRYDTKLKKESN